MSLRFNLIKDIDTFKNDAMMGLTLKETVLCGCALLFGGATHFFLRQYIGDDLSTLASIIVAAPFGLAALFNKNDMTFFEYLKVNKELKKNKTLYFSSYDAELLEEVISQKQYDETNDDENKDLIGKIVDRILKNKKQKKDKEQ